jgi:hypothetical protein
MTRSPSAACGWSGWEYVGPDVSGRCGLANGGAVIALVAEQGSALGNGLDQRFSFACIMDLPTRQSQADRTSISVDKSVEFGRKAAMGTSDAMIAGSPSHGDNRVNRLCSYGICGLLVLDPWSEPAATSVPSTGPL